MRPGARLAALAGALLLAAGGCGTDDPQPEDGAGLPSAGGGGALAYALPGLPETLDPLAAEGRSAQIVTRQVHEPLIAKLIGPYRETERHPGLALSAVPSHGRTVWTLTLRPQVRFQDGTRFNAAAVVANGRRWSSLAAGRGLLPGLFAVDAPHPNEVRFLFNQPRPDLPRLLASPRLGIVSPQALEPRNGEEATFSPDATGTGTGPFEATAVEGNAPELSRHAGWWGSPLGLGPALDAVAFVAAPTGADRLRLLRSGEVQVAEPLGPPARRALAPDPLLTAIGRGQRGIGMESSVRGFESARGVPLLSAIWLTTLGD